MVVASFLQKASASFIERSASMAHSSWSTGSTKVQLFVSDSFSLTLRVSLGIRVARKTCRTRLSRRHIGSGLWM